MHRRRHVTEPSLSREQISKGLFDDGFPYSCKLTAHESCVNAMTFSSHGARYLATGGDDLKIHVWDFEQENIVSPAYTCTGPHGNIFTVAFSATNRFLLAGGVDNTIYKYDISRLDVPDVGLPRDSLRLEEIVRSVACHPVEEEVFLSAGDDGRIIIHDQRIWRNSHPRAQDTIQTDCEATDVQWHPTLEHIFVTSEERGNVHLRDRRMAFGPVSNRTKSGIIHEYNTKISKGSLRHRSNPEPSSVAFDAEGTKLVVTLMNHLPTLYALMDPEPLAVFSARTLPDGSPIPSDQRSYSNSCTIKHGSIGALGQDNVDFYSAGSDDFCAYIWKIPPLEELRRRRQVVPWSDWGTMDAYAQSIGYAQSLRSDRYVPVPLDTPLDRLTGHNSITNTTLVHPYFPLVLISGIEQHVFLHSAREHVPFSDKPLLRTPKDVRPLGDQNWEALLDGSTNSSDAQAISLFDHVLLQEGHGNPFVIRKYKEDDEELEAAGTEEEEEEVDDMDID